MREEWKEGRKGVKQKIRWGKLRWMRKEAPKVARLKPTRNFKTKTYNAKERHNKYPNLGRLSRKIGVCITILGTGGFFFSVKLLASSDSFQPFIF